MFRSKRLLSIVMTLAMSFSMLMGMTISSSASGISGYWTDSSNIATGFASGAGTDTNPYKIATAGQLAYLAYQVNSGTTYSNTYFQLTDNIDLDGHYWTPIGNSSSNYFNGNFNGNTKIIANLCYSSTSASHVGLFGCVGPNGNIYDLTISSGSITGYRSVGAIAGKNFGTICNCHNTGVSVSSSGAKGVGGIVGANWVYSSSSSKPVIKNCSNSGSISSTYSSGSAGGIAGENEGDIYNCCNTGEIDSPYNAGGIVASNKNNYNKHNQTGGEIYGGVSNCYNTGAVDGTYAGGIIGYQIGSCVNCYNKGIVTGTTYTGQIIGQLSSSSSFDNNYLHYWTGSTVNPFGNTTSTTGTSSFGSTSTDKTDLRDDLNTWVNSHSSSIYSTWNVGSGNDGYPVFSWQ